MNHLVQYSGEPFEKWDDTPQNKFKINQSIKLNTIKTASWKNNLEKNSQEIYLIKETLWTAVACVYANIYVQGEKKSTQHTCTNTKKKSFSTKHLQALKIPPGFPANDHRIVWHGAVVLIVTAALLPRPAIFLILLIFSSVLPAACTLPAPSIPAPRKTAPWSWLSFCI